MAPVKGRSKKEEASRQTSTSKQLRAASGNKVSKQKKTTDPANVKAKSIRKTRSQKRNDAEKGTEAATVDIISKKARKGEKKITEALSTLKKDDENVASVERATRRRGKNIEEPRPIAAKKERAVRVRGVKSDKTATEQKKADTGKDVSRKRRAKEAKVAEEVPVDDTVREKVRRPARTATKDTTEMKKDKAVKKKMKDNTKKSASIRSGNRQSRRKQNVSQCSRKEEKEVVEEVKQEVKISASSSKRMRRNVVAVVKAEPKKKRKDATKAEVIDEPLDQTVESDQVVQKKRKTPKAKRVSAARGKAPVGDLIEHPLKVDQIEHPLKEEESAAANDGVKTSAKKPPARKIVRRPRARKKEVAPPISERDATCKKQEDAMPISGEDATSGKQVEESLTANAGLEGSAKESPRKDAVEFQARAKEGTPPTPEQHAMSEGQVEESMKAGVDLESSAKKSATKSAVEPQARTKEDTSPISEQDAASSDSDSCRFVCETFAKSMSVEVEETMETTAIVAEVREDALIPQEHQMECEEEVPEKVVNDDPDGEVVIDEAVEILDDIDVSVPSDSKKTDHQGVVKTPCKGMFLVSRQSHDGGVDQSTSFSLPDISHGGEEVHEKVVSPDPEIEAVPMELDQSHSSDTEGATTASDLATMVHSESHPQEMVEAKQASDDDGVVFVGLVTQKEQCIDVTTPSPTEAAASEGDVSKKDESLSSIDIAEKDRRLAATQLCEMRMKELEESEKIGESDVGDNLTEEVSGAEDIVLLDSRCVGDDECPEEPNAALPEAAEKPNEFTEHNEMPPMLFDEVINDKTESLIVEEEKLDEMEEVDKELAGSSHPVRCSESPALLGDLCLHLSSPGMEEHGGTSQRDSNPPASGTEGLCAAQGVRERLMSEVRSRMKNFMSGHGDEQHPDDGHNEPDVEGHVVNEQWICDDENDHITDNIDVVVVEDKNATSSFRIEDIEIPIGNGVPGMEFEKEEAIGRQGVLNRERNVEGNQESLFVRDEGSNKERLPEKGKNDKGSALDVEQKHQLTVDSKEDDSDIDVETVPEMQPQRIMSVEENLNVSSNCSRQNEKTAPCETTIQRDIAEESKRTHFPSSIQARFAAQHKKFWEQGPNLQEHAERIKQRYHKHQSQVPGIFQRLSKTKDNSGTCVQSAKKAGVHRFDFSTSASASTSSASFTFDRRDTVEATKPYIKGQFGVPPSYRGVSLGASARHPTRLPHLKMGVKVLTKQLAEEKRHSARYATPQSGSKLSNRLQRHATPKGVAPRDSEDKPTSSGSISYTPHKHIPAFVDTTQMSQRQFEEAVKSGIVKPITGLPPFRQTLREETKPKLDET